MMARTFTEEVINETDYVEAYGTYLILLSL